MTKQIVDEDGYIHVCNEELQRHSQYENGMEIVGAPEGNPEVIWLDMTGKAPMHSCLVLCLRSWLS